MKNKKSNRKPSPNRIKCQISGAQRMSNATYLANKGEKFGVTGNVWASFYVNKQAYKELAEFVGNNGFAGACEKYKVEDWRLKKWLRYNGRGKYIRADVRVELAA